VYRFPADDPLFVTLALGRSQIGIGRLGASPPLHGRAQRPAEGHRIELCVYVGDVGVAVEAARATGAEVAMEPADQPWGERVAYLVDPDGNLVMLVTEPDPSPS